MGGSKAIPWHRARAVLDAISHLGFKIKVISLVLSILDI